MNIDPLLDLFVAYFQAQTGFLVTVNSDGAFMGGGGCQNMVYILENMAVLLRFQSDIIYETINMMYILVPYHRGGRSKKINAWYLNTHMVYF